MRTYIILGMHRTGTTFLTQSLQRNGVHIGDNLDIAYAENRDFLALNHKIIEATSGSWASGGMPPSIEEILSLQGKFDEDIKATIARNAKYRRWAFKDPRTSITIPLLMPHVLAVDSDPFIYACFRRPAKIAESLYRRQQLRRDIGRQVAKAYNISLISFLREFTEVG